MADMRELALSARQPEPFATVDRRRDQPSRRRTYDAWSATENVIVAGDPVISQSTIVGENCNAASEAALREAARQSHDVALSVQFIARLHWVRDGYH